MKTAADVEGQGQVKPMPAAYRLAGVELPGGWIVGDLVWKDGTLDSTGGLASAQYTVTKGEQRAFLKALDFSDAHRHGNPNEAMSEALKAFAFEVDCLKFCAGQDRVVKILADGRYFPIPGEEAFFVPYMIFELAESDVRQYLAKNGVDAAWCLRSSHELTVGLKQLHQCGILHQDLKGSNALVFPKFGCKIGDVGSACTVDSDHNKGDRFLGSWNYAPPEIWYGVDVDDSVRQAGDLFMLGSLIVFMFTSVSMRALLLERHLPESHQPRPRGKWTGSYEKVLPYLQHAFGQALAEIRDHMPLMPNRRFDYRDELIDVIRHLCNPDYRQRGYLLHDAATRTLDLGRAITKLRLLAQRIESRTRAVTLRRG